MKFLFAAASALLFSICFFSCSKKEAAAPNTQSTFSYRLNDGNLIECDSIVVEQDTMPPYYYTVISARKRGDASNGITLYIAKDSLGDGAIKLLFFKFRNRSWGGAAFNPPSPNGNNVTLNTPEKIMGTFSGEYSQVDFTSNTAMLSDGHFEVYR